MTENTEQCLSVEGEALDISALVCMDTIDKVENNSDDSGQRARVFFKNGYELSIIRGKYTYGGDKGLFEIMPTHALLFDEEDAGDVVIGDLTAERVEYYINKIGGMGAYQW